MADVDSTEQRARLGARERFGRRTRADMKTRGAAYPLELIAPGSSDAAAAYRIEQLADGADSLAPARAELARRLRSREAEHQEAIFAHMRSVVPDAVADGNEQLALGLREVIAACMDCGLASIEQGAPWSGSMPSVVAAHASRAASDGVSLTTALCRCVAGYTLAWSIVLDEVVHHDLPDGQRLAVLLQASAAMGSLLAHVQTEVADAHSSEISRRARSHEQRRAEIVHKLLAGEQPDDGERAELEYELDAWHLAVIARGTEAEKVVQALAAGVGRQFLLIPQHAKTVWAWLGGEQKTAFADIERVWSKQGLTDVSLAVGEAGRSIEGWRVTHGEAQGALLVAHNRSPGITR